MTILWIPHIPISEGAVRRDQHLIRHLTPHHRIISVTWETGRGKSVSAFAEGLRFSKKTLSPRHSVYHVRRVPDLTRRFRRDKRQPMRLNEYFFQKDIRRLLYLEKVDIMITADSGFMTGYPPFDSGVPVVFDFLDGGILDSSAPAEKPYFEKSDLVLCVSAQAEEQAHQYTSNVTYLPNGVDIERLREASGKTVREEYDLRNATVVSLIGLGASGSHYFIDAIRKARREISDLKCLLVGSSQAVERSLKELPPEAREAFVYVGPIPYEEVASFFAASDAGIYPVDSTPYDDGRCPIKIFEYTALGIPVVVPKLREVERLDFSNIIHAAPNSSSFAEGIVEAVVRGPTPEPRIEEYDWSRLASELDRNIKSLI